MLTLLREILSAVLLLIGAVILLLAGVGLMRMPDTFLRQSATSKASSLGGGCILLAVAISTNDIGVSARAVAGILFLLLTAPVASHMIGRAAYIIGVPLWRGTVVDDLHGCYDTRRDVLHSSPVQEPGQTGRLR